MLLLIVLGGFTVVSAQNCSSNCLYGETFCNPITLTCTYGCKPGWKGLDCINRCQIESCEACSSSSSGENCSSCQPGVYGSHCESLCSENCLPGYSGDKCDFFGNCLYGCEVPYSGPQCSKQHCPFDNCHECDKSIYGSLYCSRCVEGYYWHPEGNKCVLCPTNCLEEGNVCDTNTGDCEKCQSGWFGSKCTYQCKIENCRTCSHSESQTLCTRCKDGMYPSNNRTSCLSCDSRHCFGMCDNYTGECKNGCQPGWYGEGYFCDRQCTIPHCSQCAFTYYRTTECLSCYSGYHLNNDECAQCPNHCYDNFCDQHTGNCVNGCKVGYYGNTCQYPCSPNCVSGTCSLDSGNCICTAGWYGIKCDRSCPKHCVQCESFTDGKCEACEAGHYGLTCEKSCSDYCQPNSHSNYIKCDQDSGKCMDGCRPGYYNDTCDGRCNKTCWSQVCDVVTGECSAGCSLNYYGAFCENPCPAKCSHVVVGYKRTCDASSGRCLEGCESGWYGDFCNKSCNSRCRDKVCDQLSGECLLGCIQGYTGANCDLICPSGCNNDCSPNCFNNMCDKSTQTCSAGCIAGWHGSTCLNICNKNCLSKVCDQNTGNCSGSCVNGYYGAECNLMCNSNCLAGVCNQFTGVCSKGCKASYRGEMCTDQCPDTCKDNICDRWSGDCTSCGLGKRGQFCNEDCILGTYGENCAYKCGHCYDSQPCNTVHGTCPSGVGCKTGYTGILCQEALQSQDESSGVTVNLAVVIGSSIAGVICIILIAVIVIVFCTRSRNKTKQHKTEEPVVMYSGTHVTIGQPSSENSSQRSDRLLLGDSNSQLNVNLLQEIYHTDIFTLYRGQITKSGRTQVCCVKVVKLTDLQENAMELSQLTREYEMLSVCGNHLNITQLLTSYQNEDVYCAALDSCVETGLVQYLLKLRNESDEVQPVYMCQMVRFAIDICSALCHIHNMKIIHRMVQARHVYLTDTSVAKLGDFHWAEHEDEPMGEVPKDRFPWLPIEVLNYQRFSPSSDIWSLGVMIWELCSGAQQPFEGLSINDYRGRILDGSRLPKLSSMHNSMYKVMKTCWRYRPSDRPTAEHVLNLLLDLQPRFSKEQSVVYI